MTVRIVRLGSPRLPGEGARIGTVRRPPRGVPKDRFASEDWYDVWFPNLAPSLALMKIGRAAHTPAEWAAFARKYRAEMSTPENTRTIGLLAVLSQRCDFSVGCYCEDELRCHRSLLRSLLIEAGAVIGGEAIPPATRRTPNPATASAGVRARAGSASRLRRA
ncbi:MAG: DUF488 family protein [Planctomycetes bacterium]|nr:DUF488 family protein [Planctomycetota bacterium]